MAKVSIRDPIYQELRNKYPNLNASEAVACALSELSWLQMLLTQAVGKISIQPSATEAIEPNEEILPLLTGGY